MAVIDTTNWVHHDNVRGLGIEALGQFYNNTPSAYTLVESEPSSSFVSQTDNGLSPGHGGRIVYRTQRWDYSYVPFLRSLVPTSGQTFLFSYETLSHGKGVRPWQNLSWSGPNGQHIHMFPVVDSLQLTFAQPATQSNPTASESATNFHLNMRFYYTSLTTNYAFPNFNDAEPMLDIAFYHKDDDSKWIAITDFPIATTGAGSNIVFSTTAPSGSVLYREAVGTGNMATHGVAHIPDNNRITWSSNYSTKSSAIDDIFDSPKHFTGSTSGFWARAVPMTFRVHSQVAPFTRNPNVPRIPNPTQRIQEGLYGSPDDHDVSHDYSNNDSIFSQRLSIESSDSHMYESPTYLGRGLISNPMTVVNPVADDNAPSRFQGSGLYSTPLSVSNPGRLVHWYTGLSALSQTFTHGSGGPTVVEDKKSSGVVPVLLDN